jgi:hypothetical protein
MKIVFCLNIIWMCAFTLLVFLDKGEKLTENLCRQELFLLERIGGLVVSIFFCIMGFQIN